MGQVENIIRQLKREAVIQAEQRTRAAAQQYGQEAKDQVFQMIRAHPVSVELKNHADSAFLGRRGSLFGFLGFDAGTDPVEELISFLDQLWTLETKKELTVTGYKISIKSPIPTRTEMKEAGLVLPWLSGRAWPFAIEEGISNLPYFLNVKKGRSGEGIQVKNTTLDSDFGGTPYLSEIFAQARAILRKKRFKIQ